MTEEIERLTWQEFSEVQGLAVIFSGVECQSVTSSD